jgi:putative intracellular protease/amidase
MAHAVHRHAHHTKIFFSSSIALNFEKGLSFKMTITENVLTRRQLLKALGPIAGSTLLGGATATLAQTATTAVNPEALNIAILLYEGFTALDAIGPYEMLYRIPGAAIHLVAETLDPIRVDSQVLVIQPTITLEEIPAPQIIVIPGGFAGTFAAMQNETLLNWLRKAHETTLYTTSVCTGALILGAADLLEGKDATTHWYVADRLKNFGATYKPERFVEAERIITAAGVSAGLDFSLYLISKVGENKELFPSLSGEGVAKAIQLITEYDPHPPFNSGSLQTASPETIALVKSVLGG